MNRQVVQAAAILKSHEPGRSTTPFRHHCDLELNALAAMHLIQNAE
jgi:hypothetical protein